MLYIQVYSTGESKAPPGRIQVLSTFSACPRGFPSGALISSYNPKTYLQANWKT